MKTLLIKKGFAALAALALLAGCSTTTPQTPEKRAARVETGVRLAVWLGATQDLKSNPQRRPAYEAASKGLSSLVAQEKWDVTALATAITETGNDAFEDDDVQLLIIAGAQLVDVVVDSQRVDLGSQIYARAVIKGADAGLKLALK